MRQGIRGDLRAIPVPLGGVLHRYHAQFVPIGNKRHTAHAPRLCRVVWSEEARYSRRHHHINVASLQPGERPGIPVNPPLGFLYLKSNISVSEVAFGVLQYLFLESLLARGRQIGILCGFRGMAISVPN